MSEGRDAPPAPRGRQLLAAAGAAAGLYALWRYRHVLTTREVRTGQTPAYPELVSQVFALPIEQVRAAALRACARMPGWTVVGSDEASLGACVRMLDGREGDVRVCFEPLLEGRLTKVRMAASTRQRLDLGASARTVRAFQATLSDLLQPRSSGHAR